MGYFINLYIYFLQEIHRYIDVRMYSRHMLHSINGFDTDTLCWDTLCWDTDTLCWDTDTLCWDTLCWDTLCWDTDTLCWDNFAIISTFCKLAGECAPI